MERFIDAGVNLASTQFSSDLEQVLQRSAQAGISSLLAIGCDVPSSARCIAISTEFTDYTIATTAGVHPHNADSANDEALEQLRAMVQLPSVVAVGETGLDFNRNFSTPAQQRAALAAQLDIAGECNKPVYLHERDAFSEQVNILRHRRQGFCGGLAHCFTGNWEQARAYLDLGLYIGITGWLCDPRRGQDLRDACKRIPLDRIVLETDAPYLLPRHLDKSCLPVPDKRRNEPALLPTIASYLAEHKGVALTEVAEHTCGNARALFGLL